MSEDLTKVFKACGFTNVDEDLSRDLGKIIDWQKELRKINIEGIKPMLTTIGDNEMYISNDDLVKNTNDKILSNAPEQDDNFFLVPKVIKI